MHIWLLLLGWLATARASERAEHRLPDTLIPTNYILEIYTRLEDPDFSFNGKVGIKIKCLKTTDNIVLHANNLTIENKKITIREQVSEDEDSETYLDLSKTSMDTENEFFIITAKQQLKEGRTYFVNIPFSGKLTEGLSGYYRSKYTDKASNTTKWVAVTQFEPTDARKAFPCFDEPAMKAQYKMYLAHKNHLTAVSNMPLIKSTPIKGMDGWVMDEFLESVPMSSYLVAYMVSEFESRSSMLPENNVTVSIWARKDAINQTELARRVGPEVLLYYEKYFDVPYPLPKQDMAAIPDFSAGAMENWGLITYRETALLYDEKVSPYASQFRVTSVIAHELAHQWFGNLVTMKWWTDLWLNEGFATYVAALGVHYVFPEWNSLDSEDLDNMWSVLSADALKSSHPVSVPIGKASEIGQIFDSISYKKGSFLLRMMNKFMSEPAFRKGVSNYLKKHKYGNAEQDDLWASLDEQWKLQNNTNQIPIKEIMDTWTIQTGYPQVTITRDYEKGTATIHQQRYLQIKPQPGEEEDNKSCWWIPITYTTGNNVNFKSTSPQMWLNCENKTMTIENLNPNEWVIFNVNLAGLYRVQYDSVNWEMISQFLHSEKYDVIPPMDRAYLIMNSLDLAWRGDIDYKSAFKLVKYIKNDKAYLPWKIAYSGFLDIDRLLRRTPSFGAFQDFMADIVTPIYQSFGKLSAIPKRYEDAKHHVTIMTWACRYDVGTCRQEALELFEQWKAEKNPDENNPIPNEIKKIVYKIAIQYGSASNHDFLWDRYFESNVASERYTMIAAVSSTREIWLLNKYLEMSIDDQSGIRKQDALLVFASIVRSDVGFYVARDFLMKNLNHLYYYYGEKSSKIGRYMSAFAENIISESELEKLASFVTSNRRTLKYAKLATDQGLETALANVRWHAQHYNTIESALAV